jgi:hypothetical protein
MSTVNHLVAQSRDLEIARAPHASSRLMAHQLRLSRRVTLVGGGTLDRARRLRRWPRRDGLFLITNMSAERRTHDYVLSTTGGILVILVALLPTARSGSELGVKDFTPGGDSCEKYPDPPACNGFEGKWGEDTARTIHQLSASTFVVLLALLCVVFALREFGYGPEAKALVDPERGVDAVRVELRDRGVSVFSYLWKGLPAGAPSATGEQPRAPRRRVLTYVAAALVIVASALWAVFGVDVSIPFVDGKVGSTYAGEFGAFVSFGIAWLTAAWDLMPGPVKARATPRLVW